MKNNLVALSLLCASSVLCSGGGFAKTCSEHGVTAGAVCGGTGSVLPPHTQCEYTTCKNTECSTGCYCIPDSSYCPSSGTTTTTCSGTITWGATSAGLQTGRCSNYATVYRCDKGFYYTISTTSSSGTPVRPPRPGSEYTTSEIKCTICPGGRPRPPVAGASGMNTASTTSGAGLYAIENCYIPKNSNMYDVTGTYQFNDDCAYSE